MKKLLSFALIFILSWGCKKQSGPTTTTFRFKVNGQSFVWDGPVVPSLASPLYTGAAIYEQGGSLHSYLAASDNMGGQIRFDLTKTDLVQPATYSYGAGDLYAIYYMWNASQNHEETFDNEYGTNVPLVSITISKLQDGFASGTFSAQLGFNMTITDGEFSDVKVLR